MEDFAARFDAKDANLSEGEYFTEVKANVGSFSPGYKNYNPNAPLYPETALSFGKLKNNVNEIYTHAEIWDKNDEINNISTAVAKGYISTIKQTASNGESSFSIDNTNISNAKAGDKISFKGELSAHPYLYGTITTVNDPEVYIRQIEGINVIPSSIKLTDFRTGDNVGYELEERTNLKGEKVFVLKTQNVKIGANVGFRPKEEKMYIDFDFTTPISMQNNLSFTTSEIMAWGDKDISVSWGGYSISDTGLDLNNNGVENESLLSTNTKPLIINKLDSVLVETFLAVAGEDINGPYMEDDEDTVSYFTPGTNADYTVKITNNTDDAASLFEAFVPIPKTGQNFGDGFQEDAFKWDAKLNGPVVLDAVENSLFEIQYASDATADNYETTANYTPTPASYDNINMIKIKSKQPLQAGDKVLMLVIKSGTRNIYNPLYRVESPKFSGVLAGTKVGSELVIAEIGGTIFEDKNGNGIFEIANGDIPTANQEVKLYKLNETSGNYEPVMLAGVHVSTTSNASGVYHFDHTIGLGYGKYAVEFTEKAGGTFQYTVPLAGTDRALDSDAIVSGPDRGWVKDIDATRVVAKTIGCGYLEYNPPLELKVNIDNKEVKTGEKIVVTIPTVASTGNGVVAAEDTIEPEFFDNIKDPVSGYVWEIADPTLASINQKDDGSVEIVGITTNGNSLATTQITLTIKDIYGEVKTSTAQLIIKDKDANVVENTDMTIGATNFVIENADAAGLTDALAKTNAKVVALEKIVAGENTTINDITANVTVDNAQLSDIQNADISVNATELNAIKAIGREGGVLPLTFDANHTITKATISKTIDVTIENNMLPEINALDKTINVNDTFMPLDGVTATDFEDGPITLTDANIVRNEVNTMVAGVYEVEYTVTDSDGNTVTKIINVTVRALPVINAEDVVIVKGDAFDPLDYVTATDAVDGTITLTDVNVISNNVNPAVPGVYQVVYSVTNSNGGTTTKTIMVTVLEMWTIQYDLQGGTVETETNVTEFNETTPDFKIHNPTKQGYTFTGWEVASSLTLPFVDPVYANLGNDVSINEGTTGHKLFRATYEMNKVDVPLENTGLVLPANLIASTIDSIDFADNNVENIVVSEEDVVEDNNIIDENAEENVVEDNIVFYEDNDEVLLENNIIVDQEDIDNNATVDEEVETSATPQTKAAEITISIPEYSGNWANGAVKKVDAIIDFGDFTSTGKKVEFTLPDGLKFVSIPVPNNYVVEPNVDAGLIDRLGTTQPLNTAITSVNLPAKQSTYGGRSTF
ncbi:hypothetical protein GJ496_010078, partial [Pomphorhynchus laevis]